jgi:rare lipoprotein A
MNWAMNDRLPSLRLACMLAALGALLAGCSSAPVNPGTPLPAVEPAPRADTAATAAAPAAAAAPQDKDGPPVLAEIPADLVQTPDAVPKPEPRTITGNPDTYSVFGEKYSVLNNFHGFRQKGLASWYGRKFQGKRTSSGESYDMFKMTAAHKTLPIPCYVRVTNLSNGRSVVVRVNDRGPFHKDRIIDLSYTAALKLAILGGGSTPVVVEALEPAPLPDAALLIASTPKAAPPPVASAVTHAPANPAAAPRLAPPVAVPTVVATAAVPPPSVPLPAGPAREPLHIAAMSATPDPADRTATTPQFLQAGLFSDPVNAVTMREQLNGMGIANVLLKSEARGAAFVHRVLIGPFTDSQALDMARKRLSEVQMPAVPVIN